MDKHVIFLLHGMGKFPKGWSADVQQVIKDAYGKYDKLKTFPFDDHFAFSELNYDHLFEELRELWRKNSMSLLDNLATNGVDGSLIPTLAKLGGDTNNDNFFNTHLLDVILYRFISLVSIPVRTELATRQIPDRLKDDGSGAEVKNWSIVCHSLGTVVGHDALHALFSPNNPTRPDPRNRGPAVGLFVANVGRLLQNDFDVYESVVRPSVQKATGIFDYYLNTHHRLDPVPMPKAFKPPHEWLDAQTRQANPQRYQDIEISEVTDINVHDFTHYLRNPKVHIPFFRALWNRQSIILQAEEKAAIQDYDSKLPSSPQLDAVKKDLQALIEKQGATLEDFLTTVKSFCEIVKC